MTANGTMAGSAASALAVTRGTELATDDESELSTQLGQEALEALLCFEEEKLTFSRSAQREPAEYSIEIAPLFSTHKTDKPLLAEAAVLIDISISVRRATNFFMAMQQDRSETAKTVKRRIM